MPFTANADWYKFTPCGFTEEAGAGEIIDGSGYQKSPNLTALYWWIPRHSVVRIVEIRAYKHTINCSYVSVDGDQWLVLGSAKDIKDYIMGIKGRGFSGPLR